MTARNERSADIPVRQWLTDYLCTISYSETDGEFHFISARYADPGKTQMPAKPFDLYLRVLREPALRANLLAILVPDRTGQIDALREEAIAERAKTHGSYVGFAALCIVGYAIYHLTLLLARYVGYDTAEAITYLPAFFAFLVIFPVQHWYAAWYCRRYCAQHSHRLESWTDHEGKSLTRCKRCGLFLGHGYQASHSNSET